MRARRIAAGVAAVGLVLLAALKLAGQGVVPSWLVAWLVFAGLPLGALPLVMGAELAGFGASPALPVLRRMLWLMPLAALAAVPLGLRLGPLYAGGVAAFPAGWLVPGAMAMRGVVMLVAWVVLAVLFAGAPRRRRPGLAAVGLMLHLGMGTLAAIDWVLALDPGVGSSAFGLLVVAAWSGLALAAALFVVAVGATEPIAGPVAPLLGVVVGAWVFLHLVQYLVVWSANLPREIVWYQARAVGWGGPALWFGAAAAGLSVLAMVPYGLLQVPVVLAGVAGMLVAVHVIEMAWLVTPGLRGGLAVAWGDVPALLALGGVAVLVLAPAARRAAHATA